MGSLKIEHPADAAVLVKRQRLQLELTQQDVADSVGITRQSVARLERGEGGTALDVYLRIVALLGISLEARDAGSDTRRADDEFSNMPTMEDVTRLRQQYRADYVSDS